MPGKIAAKGATAYSRLSSRPGPQLEQNSALRRTVLLTFSRANGTLVTTRGKVGTFVLFFPSFSEGNNV